MIAPRLPSVVLASALVACGSPPPPARTPVVTASPVIVTPGTTTAPAASAPAATAARQLAADTTVTTASGATLQVPAGWWLTETATAITLEDPDRALRATLVERPEPDTLAAIAAAWQQVAPGFTLPPRGAPDRPPPTGGWDETTTITYATAATAHRTAMATARRHAALTYVTLLDADAAAVERRGAQLEAALDSLHPTGLADESLGGQTPRPIDAARAKELDAFIDQTLATLEVPGATVAVIEDGKVVYEHAVGVRELGKPAKVTPRTLFLLASITKPMTTMMEASLVDAGVLSWDTPVTTLLPDFALGDAEVTRKVALWHMSCACTGMPRQDLEDLFEYDHVTPEARIASMKTMKPTTAFGETFQYSNLMVAAGGFAAAHAFAPRRSLGDAYAAAMRARIFAPIGMRDTTVDFAAVARAEHASPHALAIDGTPVPLPLAIERAVLPIAPAGAVWTDLRDFERFALTELGNGVAPGGRRVVSEANVLERRRVRVRAGSDDGYGLGLGVSSYHGLTLLGHDGGAFGFGTTLVLLPEQRAGLLILTNVRNGGNYQQLPFNAAVQRKILEEMFAGARDLARPQIDYYVAQKRAAAVAATQGLDRTPDAAWLAGLAGTYTNPSLGTVVIRGATFDAGEWQMRFGRRIDADGTVKIVFLDPPFAGAAIQIAGDAAHPTLVAQDDQIRYVFSR
jgi:CubicO group peptidase (beta-lactamase class C family)